MTKLFMIDNIKIKTSQRILTGFLCEMIYSSGILNFFLECSSVGSPYIKSLTLLSFYMGSVHWSTYSYSSPFLSLSHIDFLSIILSSISSSSFASRDDVLKPAGPPMTDFLFLKLLVVCIFLMDYVLKLVLILSFLIMEASELSGESMSLSTFY